MPRVIGRTARAASCPVIPWPDFLGERDAAASLPLRLRLTRHQQSPGSSADRAARLSRSPAGWAAIGGIPRGERRDTSVQRVQRTALLFLQRASQIDVTFRAARRRARHLHARMRASYTAAPSRLVVHLGSRVPARPGPSGVIQSDPRPASRRVHGPGRPRISIVNSIAPGVEESPSLRASARRLNGRRAHQLAVGARIAMWRARSRTLVRQSSILRPLGF